MVDQNSIVCGTCDTPYETDASQCPNCGEANPFITETLLASNLDLDARPARRRRNGCRITLLFLIFFTLVVGGGVWGIYEGLETRSLKAREEVEKHYQ